MLDDEPSSLPDLRSLLEGGIGKTLVTHSVQDGSQASQSNWERFLSDSIAEFLESSASKSAASIQIWQLGASSLQSFLQATVTGPPLEWNPCPLLVSGDVIRQFESSNDKFRGYLRSGLSVDGEAVYRLLPFVELFVFAKCLLNNPLLEENEELRIWRLRVNVWHQKLLNEVSPTLQEIIYRDVEFLGHTSTPAFLIERASIHILHGFDVKVRTDLKLAGELNRFQYVLTGRLGKRTKFQEKELSQLVVLAKSEIGVNGTAKHGEIDGKAAPESLQLNDDTLLESISFSKQDSLENDSEGSIPASLAALDPSDQPLLKPLDSIILLNIASSITNTSPQDGLTREETLPYIERVISGGSSNWQVYTQALIIRSRIEGYKSRTAERGVLQLQALVDQVIAETTSRVDGDGKQEDRPTTFLPRPEAQESAPASDRLRYIHLLASPPRWKLEAELADRWVSLGALRTALEIYERLELWAEVALCWAANDREDKARLIIRRQLYDRSDTVAEEDESAAAFTKEKESLPNDAPRLFCILGDLDKSAAAYERAWEVSNKRYARAQRSLGRLYLSLGETRQADEAYSKSLEVNPQNHSTWFALGCVRLQLEAWSEAAAAFTRAVQIDDSDAESWSNLAVSLLKLSDTTPDDEYGKAKKTKDSFNALKRAANLKRDSSKIWQNLLSVAIKLQPPPYTDIIIAQSRLIDLLGPVEGERCIDVPIVEALLADIIRISQVQETSAPVNGDNKTTETSDEASDPRPVTNESKRSTGLEKMVLDLIRKKITPLITSSRRLWLLTAKMHIYLHHPHAALTAYEKAWRSQLNKPGWDSAISSGSEEAWKEVGESTIDLIDAYESLGERMREAGMGEGDLVAKDWKFKARSAARSVLSRAKDTWEDDELYGKLRDSLQDLKSG